MYRYSRAVTIKNGASMQPAMQIGADITAHMNRVYGLKMMMGTQLFSKLKIHWVFDTDSLDGMMLLSSKLAQDASYWEMMGKLKPLVLEGSVKEKVIALVG